MTVVDFQPITADGVIVKRGDIVWRVFSAYALVSRNKVGRDMLRVWRMWSLHESVYADEQKAIAVALDLAKKRLAKAKAAVRNETRAIAKLKERGK